MPVRGHDDFLDRFGLPAPGPINDPDASAVGRFRRDNGLVDSPETMTLQRVLHGLHQLDTENPGIENLGTANSTVGSTENGPVTA